MFFPQLLTFGNETNRDTVLTLNNLAPTFTAAMETCLLQSDSQNPQLFCIWSALSTCAVRDWDGTTARSSMRSSKRSAENTTTSLMTSPQLYGISRPGIILTTFQIRTKIHQWYSLKTTCVIITYPTWKFIS